jgi:hypothetical protein
MAVTLQEIKGWLTDIDVKHIEKEDTIAVIFGDSDSTYGLKIKLEEDGEMFQSYMNILEDDGAVKKFKDEEHIGLILQHLLYLNYKTKFGTWEYDPRDGEVRLAVEFPLEDAKMTQKQLKRIIGLFMHNGDEHADEILTIAKTGEIPEEESSDEQMINMLRALLAEAEGQKGGSDSSSSEGI